MHYVVSNYTANTTHRALNDRHSKHLTSKHLTIVYSSEYYKWFQSTKFILLSTSMIFYVKKYQFIPSYPEGLRKMCYGVFKRIGFKYMTPELILMTDISWYFLT